MTEEYMSSRRRDGKDFHCPNGHPQHYSETEAQRLKKQLDAKQRELDERQRELTTVKCNLLEARDAKDAAERNVRRITKRIHAGVCPCCNRKFNNLAHHMQTKHPEQVPSLTIAK